MPRVLITFVINMGKQLRAAAAISDAEWEVMEALWPAHPATGEEIVARLHNKKWNPRTVKTMLNRLLKKGVLEFETEGKRYLYRPHLSRQACVKAESRSFLSKIFGGNQAEMLCRFVDEVKLSESDIRELRRILERKSKSGK